MPDRHDTETPNPEANTDWHILDLLTDHNNPRPWSIQEIILAHGHTQHTLDALERLRGDGLIHRTTDDFISPTRAAIRHTELGA